MFLPLLLAAAAALAPAERVSRAPTEMLGISVPDEFAVGYEARNGTTQIVELVEPPETVETWSKLVTSLMFFNAAQAGLDAFYGRWRDDLGRSCAGMTHRVIKGSVDGAPALRATLSCPKNPLTGTPENLEAILVQGKTDLMMVQVAFRRPVTPADSALIGGVASSLKVCDQRSLPACSARKATGFVPVN